MCILIHVSEKICKSLQKHSPFFKSSFSFVRLCPCGKARRHKIPFRFPGIAARSAFPGQHAGNSGFAAQSVFFGMSSALPHNIGRKIKGAPPGTPFKIKNTPGSGCVRSLRLYLRTPSDLESRMTSDKIMRFMSTPPIRASLNFLPYQVYHTSLPMSRGIFLLRQNAGFMHPSSCALAPICGGAPCAGYISRIYKYVKSPLPRTVEKAHPGAFGAQIRLFRKKRKNNLTSADGGVIM